MQDTPPASTPSERNRDPILQVLRRHLGAQGLVLEVASGSGTHAVHFAAGLPDLTFQPTDGDPLSIPGIDARVADAGLANVRPARLLDATSADWPVSSAEAVLCINMIHIAPWEATIGLMRGAARVLGAGGILYLYGPYRRGGEHTAPTNVAFDLSLQGRNPAWGIRNLETVVDQAGEHGFSLVAVEEMPANNLSVIFRKN